MRADPPFLANTPPLALALAGVALAQFAGARNDPVREGVAPVD